MTRRCNNCGKFLVRRKGLSIANFETQRYCDRDCYHAARKERGTDTKDCQMCGKTFTQGSITPSSWAKRKFCGRECADKNNMIALQAHATKTKRIKEEAEKLLAGRCCTKCGKELQRKIWKSSEESIAAFRKRSTCESRQCTYPGDKRGRANKARAKKVAPKPAQLPRKPKIMFNCAKHGMGVSTDGECITCNGGKRILPTDLPYSPKNRIAGSIVNYGALYE